VRRARLRRLASTTWPRPAGVAIPAIAKDFTVFPEQVARQRLAGADAILVILAMVTDDEARRLLQTAGCWGWTRWSRPTRAEESSGRSRSRRRVVGVNARDLQTLESTATASWSSCRAARRRRSGSPSRASLARRRERARDAGADAVLVGTRSCAPGAAGELVGGPR
jgi:indole-3-glycerol phosphate synthase